MSVTPEKSTPTRKRMHESIERMICQGIRDGQFKPGQKVTIVDEMIKKWGASRATVQQSMQWLATKGLIVRRPRAGTFISDDALDLISGNADKNRSICLVVPGIESVEYASLARGVEDAAHESNLSIVISSTDNAMERYEQVLLRNIESNVHGIFMVPPLGQRLSLSVLDRLQQSQIPIVTCYRSMYELMGWPVIRTNARQAMQVAAAHLAEIGRKQIAFFTMHSGPATQFTDTDYLGFVTGLIESGVKVDGALKLLCGGSDTYHDPTGISAPSARLIQSDMEKFFRTHRQVDAVCCGHDYLANMAINVLKQMGRRVPEDVAVAGRGNYARFMGLEPDELTTIDVMTREFGRHFCRMAAARRSGEKVELPPVTEIPGQLIVGRSTVTR